MRITAEAADDRCVLLGPFELPRVAVFVGETAEEGDRSLCHCEILCMLEWQVEEHALEAIEEGVPVRVDDGDSGRERQRVTGESARSVAECVAGELIEQHDVRERVEDVAARRLRRAPERAFDRISEARANRGVECRVLLEPLGARRMRWRTEPEVEEFAGEGRHCSAIVTATRATPRAPMIVSAVVTRTSYRDVFLLACCQALLLTNNAGLITMNGLVGYRLADTKSLATLGVTSYVLGSAFATMPASLWMAKVGRRMGFMAGALINIVGCALAALAIAVRSFPLYCVGTAVIGVYTAIGLQYRFAAAEVSAPKDKPRAISLVLAGGIVGGFIGPESVRHAIDLFPAPFLGGFLVLAAYAIAAIAVQALVHVPRPTIEEGSGGGRPLSTIVRQPVFIVAALAGGLGYGLMNLLMTATPIAMSFCALPFAATALVIEWHVVGMYAPGFFTGGLIQRFGVNNVILVGLALMAASVGVALNGVTIAHFVIALAMVGIGWNFMYVGGTTLLTEAYKPAEKARTQGANDFIVFSTMGVSSLASGAMISTAGWEAMNRAVLPFLAVIAVSVLWLRWRRRHAVPPPTSAA